MQQQETCTVSDALEIQAAKPGQNYSEICLSFKSSTCPNRGPSMLRKLQYKRKQKTRTTQAHLQLPALKDGALSVNLDLFLNNFDRGGWLLTVLPQHSQAELL